MRLDTRLTKLERYEPNPCQDATHRGWAVVYEDDWRDVPTPEPSTTCPSCGQPMKRRTTKDGPRSFWSCQTKYGNGKGVKGSPSRLSETTRAGPLTATSRPGILTLTSKLQITVARTRDTLETLVRLWIN